MSKTLSRQPSAISHHQSAFPNSTVSVLLGERSYPIEIGVGTIGALGPRLDRLRPSEIGDKVAVVTNPALLKLFGRRVMKSLRDAGFTTTLIVVPPGERSKDMSWVRRIIDVLVDRKFERRSTLVAVGGGVIGDLTGFVAATYLRGIPYVQVPTSVVAQVDSSVGGKTAVNHPRGKNLIGAFHQPKFVSIDVGVLETLEHRELIGGLAEVVKYGVIADAELFGFLEKNLEPVLRRDPNPWLHLVSRSCRIKASIVSEDERENGRRRILNYGHTLGHAIETATDYRWLTHGEAVSIGMVFASKLSVSLDRCRASTVERQQDLLARIGLPTCLPGGTAKMPGVSAHVVMQAMERDKKVVDEAVNFVLVDRRIGAAKVEPVDKRRLRHALNAFERESRAERNSSRRMINHSLHGRALGVR